MSQIAISCEKLGKLYRIGEMESYFALRYTLSKWLSAPVRMLRRGGMGSTNGKCEEIWAIKNVSFEVQHGEVVGLIGRNGAGKSTLLKILSRVTKPTEGRAQLRGRIGSLLEVGTGFHPELTGRENVFLNGAILGMRKSEIRRKFDQIVAFAEVEKFIDTPIRHYSSGMMVRLAFAVAAHLEAEILLVDEVLAVGDMDFQKKCLGKIKDVSSAGRTVIFVSHNLSAIAALCSRGLLIDHGVLVKDAETSQVISEYHAHCLGRPEADGDLRSRPRTGSRKAIFTSIRLQPLTSATGEPAVARPGCDLRVEVEIECCQAVRGLCVDLTIYDPAGYRLVDVSTEKKATFLDFHP
jgi:lipopolysaccharide transport system ATP-binding protein